MGSGIVIYRHGQNIKTLQYKLNKKCTNNQAEQLAILKALQYIDKTQIADKKATIYTDSQTTLDMLKYSQIHTNIVEEIRRQWYAIKKAGCQITLQWVKAHAGTRGTELADAIAKKAATNGTIPESFTRIPKSVELRQLEEESLQSDREPGPKQLKEGRRKNNSQI